MSDPVTQNYRVFISYRRDDSAYPAQHLYAQLRAHLGPERVVFDVDSIPIGADFRTYLNEQVQTCDILLAVIGDRWLDILNDRLSEPNDFVRIEVAAALESNLLVVPILVGKASVPGEKELPQDLSMLAYRNAAELRAGSDLDTHTARLISRLGKALARHTAGKHKHGAEGQGTGAGQQPQPPRPSSVARPAQPRASKPRTPTPRWAKPGMVALAAVIVAVTGWQFRPPADITEPTAADPIAEATPAPPQVEPQITGFSASATSITEGDEVRLTWSTADATQVELRPGGPVSLDGLSVVSPQQSTTYELVALGPGGETRQSIRVGVTASTSAVAQAPTGILTADPGSVVRGGSTTLRWNTTNASSVQLEGIGPVNPNGSQRVTLAAAQTFRLVVVGDGGTIQREVAVAVTEPAPAGPPPSTLAGDDNRRIWIEGGTFMMGSEDSPESVSTPMSEVLTTLFEDSGPVHRVTVSGFWIQEHEVTNEEYRLFVPGHQFQSGEERHPVTPVTWRQAMDYAAWLGGNLPTEAQWEFAARGTEGRTYPWGEAEPTCQQVQLGFLGCGPIYQALSPVMSSAAGATPEGVLGLAGNASEWVADWHGPYGSGAATDPTGPASGSSHLLRGFWFFGERDTLRSSLRYATSGDDLGENNGGFRVAWPGGPD